jgi:lysyl-tRNA synthetase class 2
VWRARRTNARTATAVMISVERHRSGPRVRVLGVRVHEWQLGLAVLCGLGATWLAHLWSHSTAGGLGLAAGAWLVVKDWRDVLPSQRDSCVWRLGLHRRPVPLRTTCRAEGLPGAAAAATALVGVVNLCSALTPNIAWRHHLLLRLEPVEAVPVFHALAVPASVALLVAAHHLRLRRRRALVAAIALAVGLGFLSLLKGLDFEEALLSFAAAAALWWGRDAFVVRHDSLRAGRSLGRLAGLAGGAFAAVSLGIWLLADRGASPFVGAHETLALLLWSKGSLGFRDELAWIPATLGLLGLLGIAGAASLLFRPLAPPRDLPEETERELARRLVRSHGADTLAFFKLRHDVHYLFDRERRAFAAYRVTGGVLLVSGDPVGPPDALPALLRELVAFADARGLRIAALGASEELLPLWAQAGLRPLYIGDEAIVDTAALSLEGRAVRKLRQAVARVERAGYTAQLLLLGALAPERLAELERIAATWLAGAPERGFSMAMDSLRGPHQEESAVVLALDRDGACRGFLHFVPVYGRPALSLSFMRREHSTPNGLTEFLVVRALELVRERGVAEVSLNFAAFARLLTRPANRFERAVGRAVALANPFFQIESLYRFNAKFSPSWEPRYLVFERRLALPRVGLAALRAEGQLPRLRS